MLSVFVRLSKKFWILFSFFACDIWASNSATTDSIEAKPEVVVPVTKPASSLMADSELTGVSSWPMVILTLIGIVGLILCLAWFAKRFGGFSATGNGDMRVVAAIPLGARERVALIDIKGQQFLLGVTAQNINHLHSFDQPVIDLSKPPKGEFAQKLQMILKSQKNAGDARE